MRAKFPDISWREKPKVRPHPPTNSLARGVLSNLAWRSLPPGDHHGTQDRMITVFKRWPPRSSIEWSTFDPQVFPDTSNTTAALRSMSRRRLEYLRETRLLYLKKKITFMLRQTLLKVEVDEQRRNCKTYSFRVPFSQAWISYRVQSWPTSE